MTFDKIKKMLKEQMNISEDKITENARIIEDLGADSLDTVEMLMSLEDEFGISISDEAAVNLKTVGDIVKYIDNNKK